MDEMKIKIGSKFMRCIIGKIISKTVYKNLGVKPSVSVNGLEAEMKDGKIHFHLDIAGDIDDKVLLKINRLIDDE